MKPATSNPFPSFPVTENSQQSNQQSAVVNTTNVTPKLNNNDQGRMASLTIRERQVEPRSSALHTMQASQFARYEKSSVPHINCADSHLTNSLLYIKKPDGMDGNDKSGFACVSMFTNTEFLKLLFEIFQPHPSLTESYETIQTNDVHQPLKLINITAPAFLEATSIAEAIYLCHLHLLAGSLTDTKLQDEIAHYDLDKCLQIMIAIDYLTSSVNNPHTRFVMDKILEKIEQDWVTTINDCAQVENTVLTNPEGKKLIRLFAVSSYETRDGWLIDDSDTETSISDSQKPTPMNREQLTEFVAEIRETLAFYPDSLNPVKRMYALLIQLFHLLDHKDIIEPLPQSNESTTCCPQAIEYYPTCPQWLLDGQEFIGNVENDFGYYVIPPIGDYRPIYDYSEDYVLPSPFNTLSNVNDTFYRFKESMWSSSIEIRAYTHPTRAGYSIMCVTQI